MAQAELSMMGWNIPLIYCCGLVTTLTLSALLSTVWLTDDHIDMMMEQLATQIAADPKLAAKCVITLLAFSRNDLGWLYFLVHINDNHWIAAFINFKDGTIGYGDLLAKYFPPPTQFLCLLQKWLHTTGAKVWEPKHSILERVK
ncbi:hypothetical protein L208DRAFT_1377625 [Tricholoma matsutake]|nr:hypothetical protein L208DRAFT_1377625 [Tricholoma matsutake 945]